MYYLDLLFVKGGPIGILIWILSVISMGIMVRSFLRLRRKNLFPEDVYRRVKSLFSRKEYSRAIKKVADNGDFFSHLVRNTFRRAGGGRRDMEKKLMDTAEHRVSGLMRSIEWLNVIGNVAPMLGLLGTVWGMIGAFFQIVDSGSPDPRLLAGDIGVALVTTMLGLVVAIPSLCVYAALRNRIEDITNDAILSVDELIAETQKSERGAA
ncbi:MAG: MotA/TolQ/ExbB proton channel family protein [Candidatus Brocadiia bacterium]|nr:MotA/TolQ/ExbB proton channel family protein [Planctomycetota bacterium]